MSELSEGDAIFCRGCGAASGIWPENPVPEHCGECPPWICDQCGSWDSAAKPCPCWHTFENDSLADIKAMFATIDLSVEVPRDRG